MSPRDWPFCPTPGENELLSSFLIRVALAHSSSPYRFYSCYFPKVSIWNRDIDLSVSDSLMERIAAKSALPLQTISDLSLRALFDATGDGKHRGRLGIRPWILSLGIYHRIRRRYGLQYCPQCLGEAGHYRRAWRQSFVLACPPHQAWLHDECPMCHSMVIPHRTTTRISECYRCRFDLSKVRARRDQGDLLNQQLNLQLVLDQAHSKGLFTIGEAVIPIHEVMHGLQILLVVFKDCARWKGRWPLTDGTPTTLLGSQNELSRIKVRMLHAQLLGKLLSDWPKSFLQFGRDVGMVQLDIKRYKGVPEWVLAASTALAAGISKPRRKTACRSWSQELLRLTRERAPGWRTKRAELLMTKACRP